MKIVGQNGVFFGVFRQTSFVIVLVVAAISFSVALRGDEAVPRLFLIGDSTMATKPVDPPNPERGWGQLLPLYLKDPNRVVNLGSNGKSTKSYREKGLWDVALNQLSPGDWVIVQFGHNDAAKNRPLKSTDPVAFSDNLRRFVEDIRGKGAYPILATSIAQRRFDEQGNVFETMEAYMDATRDVAEQGGVPLLEIRQPTLSMLSAYGPERSKQLYLWIEPGEYQSRPEGVRDDTHLSAIGASRVAEIVAGEFRRLDLPLAGWVK